MSNPNPDRDERVKAPERLTKQVCPDGFIDCRAHPASSLRKVEYIRLDETLDPALARTIIERISDAAIELMIARHSLYDDDGEEFEKEAIVLIKSDVVACMTGDDPGCNDPDELDDTNCELIWLTGLLSARPRVIGGDARLMAEQITAGLGYHGGWQVQQALTSAIESALNDAATRMRDRCVAKVRELRDDWQADADARRDPDNPHDYKGSYGLASGAVDACDDIITALESLTLEGEQEKSK